ncbi:UNVERIFIED_CONTAM: hypothetical protein HDU68_010274 [Siphonaria sp. JEL0065]|nr:hypothetical protein HDU68_010274 [Siphonaria sp. JEL0065]
MSSIQTISETTAALQATAETDHQLAIMGAIVGSIVGLATLILLAICIRSRVQKTKHVSNDDDSSFSDNAEPHFESGDVVRDVVIGLSDGLTVPFALTAGLASLGDSRFVVLAGMAEIVAGSISMGLGGYLAGKSEIEHYHAEKSREWHEVQTVPEKEEEEIYEIFEPYGMERKEIEPLVRKLKADPHKWVEFMMRHELNMEKPDSSRLWISALTIGGSYFLGGLVPLLPYMIIPNSLTAFYCSIASTLIVLFIFGLAKAVVLGVEKKFQSAVEMMLIGAAASGAAFGIAKFKEDAVMKRTLTIAMWGGVVGGLLLSLAIGAVFLVLLFKYATDLWSSAEALWEAILQLIACILMTIMAFAFLKSDELTAKWHRKLHKSLQERNLINSETTTHPLESMPSSSTLVHDDLLVIDAPNRQSRIRPTDDDNSPEDVQQKEFLTCKESGPVNEKELRMHRYKGAQAFFWIPFITVVREGLEGMLFLGGIAISEDPGHIPFAVLGGLVGGLIIGFAIFRAGNTMKLQTFFVTATIFIFYLSSGLMAKSVWAFERNTWNVHLGVADSDNSIYYNVQTSVWHTECCSPEDSINGGWQLFNAIFGWTNSATVGTVTSYILYWFSISALLVSMKLMDRQRQRLGREKVGFKRMMKAHFHGNKP